MPERILPELILGWFVALLVLGGEAGRGSSAPSSGGHLGRRS
jgi:hypothetical protein